MLIEAKTNSESISCLPLELPRIIDIRLQHKLLSIWTVIQPQPSKRQRFIPFDSTAPESVIMLLGKQAPNIMETMKW